MEIQLTFEKAHWRAFQDHLTRTLPKQTQSGFWGNMLVWMIVAVLFMILFSGTTNFHWPTAAWVGIGLLTLSALFLYSIAKLRKDQEPDDQGIFCGTHTFTFSDAGISSAGKGYQSHHSWTIVRKVERANGMIMVYFDTTYACVFPEAKLEAPDQLYQYITCQVSNAATHAPAH